MSETTCMRTVPEGWRCPVCGKVNAPWVSQCPCCDGEGTYPKIEGPYVPYEPRPWWTDPNHRWPEIICCIKD